MTTNEGDDFTLLRRDFIGVWMEGSPFQKEALEALARIDERLREYANSEADLTTDLAETKNENAALLRINHELGDRAQWAKCADPAIVSMIAERDLLKQSLAQTNGSYDTVAREVQMLFKEREALRTQLDAAREALRAFMEHEWDAKTDWQGFCPFRRFAGCHGTDGHAAALGPGNPQPHAEHCPYSKARAALGPIEPIEKPIGLGEGGT